MTPQMRDTLDYIRHRKLLDGIVPTYREIADQLGITVSNAYRRVDGLVEHGLVIRREGKKKGRNRGIELVEKTCPHCGGEL